MSSNNYLIKIITIITLGIILTLTIIIILTPSYPIMRKPYFGKDASILCRSRMENISFYLNSYYNQSIHMEQAIDKLKDAIGENFFICPYLNTEYEFNLTEEIWKDLEKAEKTILIRCPEPHRYYKDGKNHYHVALISKGIIITITKYEE